MNTQSFLYDALDQMRSGEPESAAMALQAAIRREFRRKTRMSDVEARVAAQHTYTALARWNDAHGEPDPVWKPILQAIRILNNVCAPSLPQNLCGSSGIAALELAYEASCEDTMKEYTRADRVRQFRVAAQALAEERKIGLITFQEYCLRGAELARIYLGTTPEDATP